MRYCLSSAPRRRPACAVPQAESEGGTVDLRDSPAEAQFRSALRAWLAANKPA